MIFTYFGIILFFIAEWVKFIKTELLAISERHSGAWVIDSSRHPV